MLGRMVVADIEELIALGQQRRARLPSPHIRRHIREQAGLTQREIAAYLDISRPSLTRYELGTREPRGRVRDGYQRLLHRLTGEA
jgi:DNA-binding transcriptional regulator YiaG